MHVSIFRCDGESSFCIVSFRKQGTKQGLCFIIRTFQLFLAGTVFFSHNKSANSTFSHEPWLFREANSPFGYMGIFLQINLRTVWGRLSVRNSKHSHGFHCWTGKNLLVDRHNDIIAILLAPILRYEPDKSASKATTVGSVTGWVSQCKDDEPGGS
jgi:hypothetical protein